MDNDFGPKTRVSLTAVVSGTLAVASMVCLVLAYGLIPFGWDTLFSLELASIACLPVGLVLGVLAMIDIRRSEGALRGLGWVRLTYWNLAAFALAACLMPAAEYWGPARRSQSINNLKQIGLALDWYHDAHGRYPPAVVTDRQGRLLYSWRVLILPFMEQEELYRKFHLDEPWDGPHNRRLIAELPRVYDLVHRRDEVPRGMTFVQVFRGPGTAFESARGERREDITDGRDHTILAVEARTAVAWTRPIDLPFMAEAQLPILGGTYRPRFGPETPRRDFLAVMADGTVHTLRTATPEATLRALITRNGGEPIHDSDY